MTTRFRPRISCSPRHLSVHGAGEEAFTLVEVMLASVIVVLMCGMLMEITGATGRIYRQTKGKIEQFTAARTAFQGMTERLAQATLNTYWDYDNPFATVSTAAAPAKYIRQSELRFICGNMTGSPPLVPSPTRSWTTKGVFFHAPLGYVDRSKPDYRGLENLLNTWGYFVEFGDDGDLRPPILTAQMLPLRYRFRLMELMAPSDLLVTYSKTSGLIGTQPATLLYKGHEWFTNFVNVPSGGTASRPVHPLAENVVALLVVPKLSKSDEERRAAAGLAPLCADYTYDTYYDPKKNYPDPEINPSNQLPPILQVTMVAIDEAGGSRLAGQFGTQEPSLGLDAFRETTKLFDDPSTPAPEDGDLSKLGQVLATQKLNYRVFTTDVTIRAARWSRDQK